MYNYTNYYNVSISVCIAPFFPASTSDPSQVNTMISYIVPASLFI